MVSVSISGGVSWTDVAVALAAIVGTIAAIVAAAAALAQLRSAEIGRRDQLRPILLFERAALLPGTATNKFVELTLVNHGPGPVVDARLRVRLFPMDSVTAKNTAARDKFISECIARLGATPPTGHIEVHGIGPGQTAVVYLMDKGESLIPCGEDHAVVFVTAQFRDVFNRVFDYPRANDPKNSGYIFRLARLQQRTPSVAGT